MKKKKFRFSFLFLFPLVFSLLFINGCSKKTEEPNTNTEPKENQTTDEEQGQGQQEEAGKTADPNATATDIKLPLTDSPVTLSIWMPMDVNLTASVNNYNDAPFFKEMEKRTGVHLEFQTPATGEEQTSFNLMIASGELTDIITMANLYPDGYDAAIEDDYFLDLTPYMDTYLSNYNKLRLKDELIAKSTITDSGRIGAIYSILNEPQPPWLGMQVRKDWLDDCGLDIPVTYDDWEEMLTAFKEQKNAYAPLALNSYGFMSGSHAMSAGYQAMSDFMNVDGTVVYGPITDGWRQYLIKMADWYKKGLINPDFMTSAQYFVDTELVTSGQSGAWCGMYTMASLYEQTSQDKNMEVIPVVPPVVKEGDDLHIRLYNAYYGSPVAISADCKNKEIAMQWLDYLSTEEGSLLANYGTEGVSFEYTEEGKPQFNDLIINNPDGLSMSQAMCYYSLVPSKLPGAYDWTRELVAVPEKDRKSLEVWGSTQEDYILPTALSYTSEESRELASIYTDIQTYTNENTTKFITGVLDINGSDWDKFVSTIEGMNIARCIEIKQAALERFNAR